MRAAAVLAGLTLGAWCAGWVLLHRHGPAPCPHLRTVAMPQIAHHAAVTFCSTCDAVWPTPRP